MDKDWVWLVVLVFFSLFDQSCLKEIAKERAMTNLPAHHEDHPEVISRNARVGLVLFCVYFAVFVGFLMLNVFAPQVMSATEVAVGEDHVITLWGTNVGVVYGVGLIVLAIALAVVYMRAVRRRG
jgi:uncharacterized membrane protein (DUF485 family)